ncbi:nuclear transport factor 2 family protein [Dyella monticola]|uniref:Nuclear transport factor 2 family protein n=1 Tax=Dyella monticola TaxID=1927958 RepID=A0A370X918_9GAMM|nr:nuclear transport factor 2 family protein [Dyella monticola]RDS84904.1 nuclear transport factor 2 family protein [Dyella monticola]
MTNKRILRIALTSLLLSGTVNAAPQPLCDAAGSTAPTSATVNDTVAQRLISEERASWDLAIKRDAAAYKAFHAQDFITVTGSGVVGKGLSEASAMDAHVRFDQCTLSMFDVRFVAQNAALVTYHVKAMGLDHDKPFQLESFASSLWVKRSGAWLNVFYQATPASNH